MNSGRLLSSSILQSLQFILTLGVTFFMTPFIIGKLGDYRYGLWVLMTTITGYFALSELGISSAVQNQLSVALGRNDPDSYTRLFSNACFLYKMVSGLVLVLVLLLTVGVLLVHNLFSEPYIVLILLVILGFNLSISFLFYPHMSVLASHIRFDITAGIAIFHLTMYTILTVVALNLGFNLIGMAIASFATGTVSGVLILYASRKQEPTVRFRKQYINRVDLKNICVYGGKTFATQLSDILRFKTDEIMVASFVSVNMVTHYNVANRLVTVSNELSMKLLSVLNPLFAQCVGREDREALQRLFLLSFKFVGPISMSLYACLIVVGKPFVMLWLGPRFSDVFLPILLLGGAYLIARMQSPGIALLYATNTHQYFAYMSVAEGIANLVLSLLFVVKYGMGMTGVALGTLIPTLCTKLLVQPWLVGRLVNLRAREYYLLLAKVFITGLPFYGLFYVVTVSSITMYSHILVSLVILFCACLAHLFLLLTESERTMTARLVKSIFVNRPLSGN